MNRKYHCEECRDNATTRAIHRYERERLEKESALAEALMGTMMKAHNIKPQEPRT